MAFGKAGGRPDTLGSTMRFQIHKGEFARVLSHQQSIIQRRSTVPILSHVLLEADVVNQEIILTGTDLEISLVERVPAKVDAPGVVAVPVHVLHDVVRRLSEPVQVEWKANDTGGVGMTLRASQAEFFLPTLPASEFPPIKAEGQFPHKLEIAQADLLHMIEQTRFAMSTEEARYALNGIHFRHVGGRLTAVASDTHRLSLQWIPWTEGDLAIPSLIMSRKTIVEMVKIMDGEGMCTFQCSDKQMALSLPSATFYSRLIEGVFPDYTKAIPVQSSCQVLVHNEIFMEAVDRVSMVASDKNRVVRLRLESGQMWLSAQSPELGSASETLAADYQGDPIEIGINPRYILDICHHIAGERVRLSLGRESTPVLIEDPHDAQSLHILMPMRIASSVTMRAANG